MNETVERAARAGYEQRIRGQFGQEAGLTMGSRIGRTLTWVELPEEVKEQERAIARAVIDAALK